MENNALAMKKTIVFTGILITVIFYGFEYLIRTNPSIIIPELKSTYHLNSFGIGSLVGMYYYTYAPFALIAGLLLDEFDARKVIPIGFLICAIGTLMFGITQYEVALLGRLLQGMGSAFAFVSCVYLLTKYLSPRLLPLMIGIVQSIGMLGGALGQGPSAYILQTAHIHWQSYWFILGIIGVTLAVLAYIFIISESDKSQQNKENNVSVRSILATVFKNPQSWLCSLTSAALFAPTTIFAMIFAIPYIQLTHGISRTIAASVVSMVPIGWIIGCVIMGWIAVLFKNRKIPVFLGIVGVLVFLLLVIYNTDTSVLTLSAYCLILGIFSGTAMIPYSIAQDSNGEHARGTTPGFMNVVVFGITAVLAQITGAIMNTKQHHVLSIVNYQHAFIVLFIGLIIALILFIRVKDIERIAAKKNAEPALNTSTSP